SREDRDNLPALLRAVEDHAAIVRRSIESLRDNGESMSARAAPTIAPERIRDLLRVMAAALGKDDLSASAETLAELETAGVPADMASDLSRLRELVDGYEFDGARRVVSCLIERKERV